MEKKTIGSFIAVLRKANGMTQQELADRLFVSNKAVSRWERDESAPDLSLIPVLAELFGVTCDELLKGERIAGDAEAERAAPKIEKQVRQIFNRRLLQFKSAVFVAVALVCIGFVCFLAVYYGFYRPIIGFSVLLVFVIAGVVLTLLAKNRLNESVSGYDIPDALQGPEGIALQTMRRRLTFMALFLSANAVFWSLPLMLIREKDMESIMPFGVYVSFVPLLAPISFLAFEFFSWIGNIFFSQKNLFAVADHNVTLLNSLQIIISAGYFLTLYALQYFKKAREIHSPEGFVFLISAILFLAVFAFCVVRGRPHAKLILLTGFRNIGLALGIAVFIIGFHSYSAQNMLLRRDFWMEEGNYYLSMGLILFSWGLYYILKKYWKGKKVKS